MSAETKVALEEKLREANLRPTKQRMALAQLLFTGEDRHVAAESLYEEACEAGIQISLATIYNSLHQFTESGLLRSVSVDSNRAYFDTNTDHHHHFFIEGENRVMDIPHTDVSVGQIPVPPEGMEISSVDVIIRVRENNRRNR